jgi:hypothetical protein
VKQAHRVSGMGKPETRKRSRQRHDFCGLAQIVRVDTIKGGNQSTPPGNGSTQKDLVPSPSARLEVAQDTRQG